MNSTPRPADELPLAGYTVLDLTRVLAGPYCTRILADMGARVIKIERPGDGDDMRRNYMQLEPGRTDQSSYFMRVNAGKESVAIDMAQARGPGRHPRSRPARRRLRGELHARRGRQARLRRGDLAWHQARPRVLLDLRLRPDGPWRARPAFAHIINAASGLMHLEQGDEPAPRASNLQAADVLAGTHAVGAIVGALLRRGRTGKGAHLDVSMLEALISADSVTYAAVLNGGEEAGNPRPGMVVAPIGDRSLAMQFVGSGELWPRLLALMGRPELGRDARFDTADNRRAHWRALREIVVAWLGNLPERGRGARRPRAGAHSLRTRAAARRSGRPSRTWPSGDSSPRCRTPPAGPSASRRPPITSITAPWAPAAPPPIAWASTPGTCCRATWAISAERIEAFGTRASSTSPSIAASKARINSTHGID